MQGPTAHVGFSVNLPPLVPPIVLAVPIGANTYIATSGSADTLAKFAMYSMGHSISALPPAEKLDPVLTTLVERELTLLGAA